MERTEMFTFKHKQHFPPFKGAFTPAQYTAVLSAKMYASVTAAVLEEGHHDNKNNGTRHNDIQHRTK